MSIDYDPDDDNVDMGSDGDDGNNGGDLVNDFDDDGGELVTNFSDNDDDMDQEMLPEDQLDNAWRDLKELKGDELVAALKELLEKEKTLMDGEKTNYGFKSIKHLILNAFQAGKNSEITKWFKIWVADYKQFMKEHLQSVTKLLDKLIKFEDLSSLVELSFAVADKLNKIKLLIIKGKGLMLKEKQTDEELNKLVETLEQAHSFCKNQDGTDDTNNVNLLLEIYSLKIQLAEKKRNNKEMKIYFDRANALTERGMASNAVLGTIFSCGGRARMREAKFAEASQFFFEAVKNYDQCRKQDEAIECLKLKVFSSLLSGSKVNPFDDQVAASYLAKPAIKNYERIVKDVLSKNADSFLVNIKPLQRDDTVKEYVGSMKRLIQKDLFLEVVKPYSNISMAFVGKRIHTTPEETESILVELILNKQINGTIDQATGTLMLKPPQLTYQNFYGNLLSMASHIDKLQRNVLTSIS